MAINNLRARSLMAEDAGDSNALRAAPAAAPAASLDYRNIIAQAQATGFQPYAGDGPMQAIVNGLEVSPYFEGVGGSEQDSGAPQQVGYTISTPLGGTRYRTDVVDMNGNLLRSNVHDAGSDKYGLGDMAKLAAAALGANYLLPALAGGEAALGSAGIGGAESAAFADMAAGLTPEFGTTAAYNAAATPAVAAAAAPEIAAAAAPTAQLTPAAIEAGLGTPGYGYSAAAEASGLFNPATIGAGAALPFEVITPAAAGAAGAAAAAAPAATAATQAGTMAAAASPFAFLAPAAATLLGSYLSGQTAKSAAETTAAATTKAAELQSQAQKEALDLQKRMYEEGVARQQPFYQAGVAALPELQRRAMAQTPGFEYGGEQPAAFQYGGQQPTFSYAGQQPEAFKFTPDQLQTDPGYGFRLSEGLKALERSAAARGGLLSGGTGKALTRYGQEMGSQEYQNAYGRALTGYNALVAREQQQYGRALTGYEAERAREADQYGRALTGYNALAAREREQYGRALTAYNAARTREAEDYSRLAGLAGVGGSTAQQIGAAGSQYAGAGANLLTGTAANIGNLMAQQGQITGNALMAQGSAYQQGLGNVANLYARMYGPQQPTYVLPYGPPPG